MGVNSTTTRKNRAEKRALVEAAGRHTNSATIRVSPFQISRFGMTGVAVPV